MRSTGLLLLALGDVRSSQHLWHSGMGFYERALAQFRSTVGETSINTADARCKIAVHHLRQGNFDLARYVWQWKEDTKWSLIRCAYNCIRQLLDEALKTYHRGPYFSAEVARTSYLLSEALSGMGHEEDARRALQQAARIRKGLIAEESRPTGDLQQSDFDSLVVFWKR